MLRHELTEYINMRKSETKFSGDNYNFRFLCIPLGDDGRVKISAATKLLKQMSGFMIYYTDEEIHALKSGRLGGIFNRHYNELPASFFPQERQTAVRDSQFAREYLLNKYRR